VERSAKGNGMVMTASTLAELALKIWGVILVLGGILELPAALWMSAMFPSSDPQAVLMRRSQVAVMLGIMAQGLGGLVILVWADRIVALFESDNTPLPMDVTGPELQRLAFAVVGVVVLIDGVQSAAAAGYVLLTKPPEIDALSYMWQSRQHESMIKGIVQLVAGALLVLGRESIVEGWTRLREARRMDADDPDIDDGDNRD
jgi:hypothetical protein